MFPFFEISWNLHISWFVDVGHAENVDLGVRNRNPASESRETDQNRPKNQKYWSQRGQKLTEIWGQFLKNYTVLIQVRVSAFGFWVINSDLKDSG